jgi:hypothetical protein
MIFIFGPALFSGFVAINPACIFATLPPKLPSKKNECLFNSVHTQRAAARIEIALVQQMPSSQFSNAIDVHTLASATEVLRLSCS